jgi:hypothetical protein
MQRGQGFMMARKVERAVKRVLRKISGFGKKGKNP